MWLCVRHMLRKTLSERIRCVNTAGSELSFTDPGIPLPKQMDTFWPSNSNKLPLQKLIYSHIWQTTPLSQHCPTVLGQVKTEREEWQCIMTHGGQETQMSHLQSTGEETDLWIALHVLDSLDTGHKVCVVISSDTDVTVTLLYHIPIFLPHGLEQLWVQAGAGDTSRYVPLHILFQRLGGQLCSVLPALHSLTGCDITSRVGTKKAALKAEPERFLKQFGMSPTLSQSTIDNAEQYLVKVLKKGSTAKTFTEYREETFHFSKCSSLQNLPPTSHELLPHIQHAFYNAYTTMNILSNHFVPGTVETLKPKEYGFKYDNGYLMPTTAWKTLDGTWSVFCSCVKCVRFNNFPCRMAQVISVQFCHCKKASRDVCKNPVV